MSNDSRSADDAGAAGTERFNTVVPDLGSAAGWDRSDLSVLFTLYPGDDGALYSPHAHLNANGAVFGGQLIGQALTAAQHDVPSDMPAHSMQINFLRPGLSEVPMRYEVRNLMRGRSFLVQQVTGTQGARVVINATASFHHGEAGPRHQAKPPAAMPDPDSLPILREVMERNAHRVPEAARRRLGGSRILDLRPVDADAFLFDKDPEARFRYWIRVKTALPDNAALHQAVLGYLSDYWFPLTSMAPHLDNMFGSGLYVASLNHTIWFHGAARAHEWLLVDAVSPFSGSSRGLTTGQLYDRQGTLVLTVAQEGLYRGWVQDEDGGFRAPGMSSNGF